MKIEKIFNFLDLTLKFRDIYRKIKIKGKVSTENDAEHSYQLAMFCWYIATVDQLPLDINKILKYALVHDFVEVYAGDTHAFPNNAQILADKESREEEARRKLLMEFPEFSDFHDAILEYEYKNTEESRFVYAADKIIAEMNIYMEGNTINIEEGLTVEKIRRCKDQKIAISPHIEKYWQEFIPLMKNLESKTFL